MAQAATRARQATDVAGAAAATASMLATCGDCHTAMKVSPTPAQVVPPAVGGVVGHMLAHQQAADDLFRGLVIPSASTWYYGAKQLGSAPLRRQELPRDQKLTRRVTEAEARARPTTRTRAPRSTPSSSRSAPPATACTRRSGDRGGRSRK
jgi:hypothetical protein